MKKISIVLLTFVCALTGFAQNSDSTEIKTLFGNKHMSHGGYGGLVFGVDEMDGSVAFHSGIRAAWMIGHSFGLGFAASGFSNNIEEFNTSDENIYNLNGGCGGILFEPVFAPKFPVHFTFPMIAGAGAIVNTHTYYLGDNEWDAYAENETFFLMFQPGAEIEVNLFKFFRIGAGVSYKFTTKTSLPGKDDYLLGHPMYNVTLKLGKF